MNTRPQHALDLNFAPVPCATSCLRRNPGVVEALRLMKRTVRVRGDAAAGDDDEEVDDEEEADAEGSSWGMSTDMMSDDSDADGEEQIGMTGAEDGSDPNWGEEATVKGQEGEEAAEGVGTAAGVDAGEQVWGSPQKGGGGLAAIPQHNNILRTPGVAPGAGVLAHTPEYGSAPSPDTPTKRRPLDPSAPSTWTHSLAAAGFVLRQSAAKDGTTYLERVAASATTSRAPAGAPSPSHSPKAAKPALAAISASARKRTGASAALAPPPAILAAAAASLVPRKDARPKLKQALRKLDTPEQVRACVRACVYMCVFCVVYVYIYVCVLACGCACVCVCVCMCVCLGLQAHAQACALTCVRVQE